MTINEHYKVINLVPLLAAQDHSIAAQAGVNVEVYEGDALAILTLGAASGVSATLDIKLQGSKTTDSNGEYADIVGAAFAQVGPSDDNKIATIGVDLTEYKFVRAVPAISNTSSPLFTFAVVLVVDSHVGKEGLNSATAA